MRGSRVCFDVVGAEAATLFHAVALAGNIVGFCGRGDIEGAAADDDGVFARCCYRKERLRAAELPKWERRRAPAFRLGLVFGWELEFVAQCELHYARG